MFGCYQRHLLPGRQQGSVSNIYVEFDNTISKYHIFVTVALKIYSLCGVGVLKLQGAIQRLRQEPFDLNFAVC